MAKYTNLACEVNSICASYAESHRIFRQTMPLMAERDGICVALRQDTESKGETLKNFTELIQELSLTLNDVIREIRIKKRKSTTPEQAPKYVGYAKYLIVSRI